MQSTRQIDAFWTVQNGKRHTISLSEGAAWASLQGYWAYGDDRAGWTVERSMETVPVVLGKVFVAEREVRGSDDNGEFVTLKQGIAAPHVGWDCPHCGVRHTTDLCDDVDCKTEASSSPQLWFCERGRGIALVEW